MSKNEALYRMLSEPIPVNLWILRSELLKAGVSEDSRAFLIIREFHRFLNELVASSNSRQFSHFASYLDIGALGGVAIQNLLSIDEQSDWWQRLLAGGISEGLMVMASRQYVKAWEEEMKASYLVAAWYLAEEFWRLSANLAPNLPTVERQELIDGLIGPIRAEETAGIVKAAIIVHYFQLLIVANTN